MKTKVKEGFFLFEITLREKTKNGSHDPDAHK